MRFGYTSLPLILEKLGEMGTRREIAIGLAAMRDREPAIELATDEEIAEVLRSRSRG